MPSPPHRHRRRRSNVNFVRPVPHEIHVRHWRRRSCLAGGGNSRCAGSSVVVRMEHAGVERGRIDPPRRLGGAPSAWTIAARITPPLVTATVHPSIAARARARHRRRAPNAISDSPPCGAAPGCSSHTPTDSGCSSWSSARVRPRHSPKSHSSSAATGRASRPSNSPSRGHAARASRALATAGTAAQRRPRAARPASSSGSSRGNAAARTASVVA